MAGIPYRTRHGNCPWECISALQKHVRRNEPLQAVQVMAELAPSHLAFGLNRLRVISHEDIGLANPALAAHVKSWTEQAWELSKGGDNEKLRRALVIILLAMCRSPKSREADSFQCVGFDLAERGEPIDAAKLPDFINAAQELPAMHAAAAVALTKPAAVIRTLLTLARDERFRDEVRGLARLYAAQFEKWQKSGNGAWRLALSDIILLLCRQPEIPQVTIPPGADIEAFTKTGYADFDAGKAVTIPDYALCKHTRRGKKLGRGIEHFRLVGAVLNPKPVYADKYEDEAYKIWGRKEAASRPAAPVPKVDPQRVLF